MLPPESRLPALLLAALAVVAPTAALADMSFYVVNQHKRGVALEFVGPDRVWPGGDKVYLIEGSSKKSVPIDCKAGERICYGAWENGDDRITWGIGPDRDKPCNQCCRTCLSSGSDEIVLGGE